MLSRDLAELIANTAITYSAVPQRWGQGRRVCGDSRLAQAEQCLRHAPPRTIPMQEAAVVGPHAVGRHNGTACSPGRRCLC
jgi:hypothetical protein